LFFKFWRVDVEIEEEEKKKKKDSMRQSVGSFANAPYRDEGEGKIVWKPPWTPPFGYGYRVISHVPSKEYKDNPHVGVCVALASGIIYFQSMTTEWEKQGQTKKLSKKERVKLCLLRRENIKKEIKLCAMLVLEYYKAQLGMVIQDLSSICMGLIRPLFSICQRPQLETLTFGWWCTFLWNHGSHIWIGMTNSSQGSNRREGVYNYSIWFWTMNTQNPFRLDIKNSYPIEFDSSLNNYFELNSWIYVTIFTCKE